MGDEVEESFSFYSHNNFSSFCYRQIVPIWHLGQLQHIEKPFEVRFGRCYHLHDECWLQNLTTDGDGVAAFSLSTAAFKGDVHLQVRSRNYNL